MISEMGYRHRSVTLLNVPAYLAARSIDPVELLRRIEIPVAFFSDVNAFIPRDLCFALEDKLLKLTGDGMLGGDVGNRNHISELGPWGHAILAAATLRDALSFAIAQIHTLQTGFTLAQFRERNSLIIAFFFEGRSAYQPTQHILGSAVVIRKIALMAGVPDAVEVLLQRPY
jgi:hypothetical protein